MKCDTTGPSEAGAAARPGPAAPECDQFARTENGTSAMPTQRQISAFDSGHPDVERVLDRVDSVVVGKRHVAERMVCALIADGHVLLEDVPGVGKTLLAKTLAEALALSFARIQFTPDLLPSDILGVSVWDPSAGRFRFQPGPVFTNILLADEINRTSPRTQSALLEVMEERQVSLDGESRPVPDPFVVIATENPIEYEGTFPLPEAQLDRFLFRLRVGYPDVEEEVELLRRLEPRGAPAPVPEPVLSRRELLALREQARRVHVAESVLRYMSQLADRTRRHPDVYLGASPRAVVQWLRAAQAWALMRGRSFVIPDDVRLLASDVLGHRLVPRAGLGQSDRQQTAQAILGEILATVPAPAGDAR